MNSFFECCLISLLFALNYIKITLMGENRIFHELPLNEAYIEI